VIVDLSHPVEHGMTTYPGLPGPVISTYLSRAESAGRYGPGTTFRIGRIDLVANTGTYLDAPSHRFADGDDLAALPLERTADLDAVLVAVLSALPGPAIDADALDALPVRGRAVLLHTGWSRHWRTPDYGAAGAPYLSRDGARWLAEHGAALVGIDSVNIDSMADPARPAHSILLRAGIPVLEHLCNLDRLPRSGFRLHAAPVAIRGLDTFPVRAYAVLPG
jgi:kynurenine formamidase